MWNLCVEALYATPRPAVKKVRNGEKQSLLPGKQTGDGTGSAEIEDAESMNADPFDGQFYLPEKVGGTVVWKSGIRRGEGVVLARRL